MNKSIILFFSILVFGCNAQENQALNLDFEQLDSTQNLPIGWYQWGKAKMNLDSLETYAGKYALRLSVDSSDRSVGSGVIKIPAAYESGILKLSGYLKTKGLKEGFAGLLLRIDGEDRVLSFDNMERIGVNGNTNWKRYEIQLPLTKDAEIIYVGGFLEGKGQAWFDYLRLELNGRDIHEVKKVRKLSFEAADDHEFDFGSGIEFPVSNKELIQDLALLGQVWGFLKYHHPAIAEGKYNWDYDLFRFLPNYLEAKNRIQRDALLLQWIASIGSLEGDNYRNNSESYFIEPDHSWISQNAISNDLKRTLLEVYNKRHSGLNSYYISTASGVGNPVFKHEKSYRDFSYPDPGFRLLAVYRYWNAINYFFPYKGLINRDWNEVLHQYIPEVLEASTELEYEKTMTRIIGEVNDSHAGLWGGADKIEEERGTNYAPVQVKFIEGVLTVVGVKFGSHTDLLLGDVIEAIEDEPVEDCVKRNWGLFPGSNKAARLRNMAREILRSSKKELQLLYRRDGKAFKTKLILTEKAPYQKKYEEDKSYKILSNNIGYVNLSVIRDEEVSEIKSQLKDTRGIIIDIRNYPSAFVTHTLGEFFIENDTPFARFSVSDITTPGSFFLNKPYILSKTTPDFYKGKLIVLVNEESQSNSEFTTMALKAGINTTIVGNTTAGADGNISVLNLPGNMSTAISGIGVYYPDGTETQRIGIIPDVYIEPTIVGIKEGKDEVFDKAIELIEQEND